MPGIKGILKDEKSKNKKAKVREKEKEEMEKLKQGERMVTDRMMSMR